MTGRDLIFLIILGAIISYLVWYGTQKDQAESQGKKAPPLIPLDKLNMSVKDVVFGALTLGLLAWNFSLQSSINEQADYIDYHSHDSEYSERGHSHSGEYAEENHDHSFSDIYKY